MKLLEIANKYHNVLTDVEFVILDYIIENQSSSENYNIDDLARLTHTSKSSIVRLSQKLGFSGFSEFKYFLKYNNSKLETTQKEDALQLLNNDIEETLKYIKSTDFEPLIELIRNSKRIFAFGTGHGENVAMEDLARNFLTSHIFITVFPSITEFFWNVDSLTEEDVVIVCSYSGNNEDLMIAVNRLKLKSVKIVSITPMWTSKLTKNSDLSYFYFETPLNIESSNFKEFNFYVTCNILIDTIYRSYLDTGTVNSGRNEINI